MTTKIVIPNNDNLNYPCIDGVYVKIPLDKPLKKGDVIAPVEFLDCKVYIVETPTHETTWYNNEEIEYWLHTVVLFHNVVGRFLPKKYLSPETVYQII